jgi:hypothetical protein
MRVENVKGAVWTVDDLEYSRRRPLKLTNGTPSPKNQSGGMLSSGQMLFQNDMGNEDGDDDDVEDDDLNHENDELDLCENDDQNEDDDYNHHTSNGDESPSGGSSASLNHDNIQSKLQRDETNDDEEENADDFDQNEGEYSNASSSKDELGSGQIQQQGVFRNDFNGSSSKRLKCS